jgi:phage terminase Nu1 subunit (DNA packaging protein)
MKDDATLVSRGRAAQLLKRDTRTIKAALEGVPPDEDMAGRPKRWKLATIRAAVARRLEETADYTRNGAAASASASLTAARARLTSDKARIVELQRKKLEGSLVPIDQVEALWAHQVAVARSRLLAIPAKCAARVGMEVTTAEVAEILREEVYRALDELSRHGDGREGGSAAGHPAAG